MRSNIFARLLGVALAGVTLATAAPAVAVDYPTKPVRWIVTYPPGGTTDLLARLIGNYLSEHLGQTFIIENKPGGGNNIGTEFVARSPHDGYTLLLVNPANGINQSLYKNLKFDILTDIAPVAGITRVPNVMEVTPNFPAKTVAEFIAYAKANPGKVNMASSGTGTSVHMSGELFMAMTGVKMAHVPYKGAGPALVDLMAGTVDVMFDNLPSSIGHIQGGKLRAMAVTTDKRNAALPDVPTVAETVPGYEASAWFGMGVPKGTPADVIDKLNKTVNEALQDPKMVARLAELGGTPMAGTPADFGKVMASEVAKWKKVVEFSGATVEYVAHPSHLRRSSARRHLPADLDARLLEQSHRPADPALLQSDRGDRLRAVAQVHVERTQPCPLRRRAQHLRRQDRQESAACQQIEPHVDRDGRHDRRRKRQLSAAEQLDHDAPEERVGRREGPLLRHQVGETEPPAVEERMASRRHHRQRRLEQQLSRQIFGHWRRRPTRHQHVTRALAQLADQRVQVAHHHVVADARILTRQPGDDFGYDTGDRLGGADLDDAAGRIGQALDRRYALADLVEDHPRVRDEKPPGFRQRDAARGSIEQRYSEDMLHVRDRLGDGRLGQGEAFGRLCHAAHLRHGLQRVQILQPEPAPDAVVPFHQGSL